MDTYFIEHGYHNKAIYGIGEIGERFYEETRYFQIGTYRKYVRFVINIMEPFIRESNNVKWNRGIIKLLFYINNQINSKHLQKKL